MPRFTFTTPNGPRAVRAADEDTARAYLETQLHHPDPNGTGGQPYTSAQLAKIRRERDARAALLTLREEQ
ncbi:hypothetical protein OG884_15345 [Streptosporangium sp. NBC_01755]|uniref:hypothetical protein n=1 Tax=Streptosporangium sp. NBC_01755 TaxID=2975949 RepID=UPI002DDAF484|nr:hypothetical protein [Streptosporangium sp. NBC_01755]WSD03208.1 hypothetical protein OG884_15345 [Streptosporangium sp. NBC_01755]